jgi:PPK2 family polyphosphate:nucleotide phosphotransferase
MFKAVASPYRVPYDGTFRYRRSACAPPVPAPAKQDSKQRLQACIEELDALQRMLYAHDNHAMLLVFQAMDAAGKDGTIRAVLTGIDPAGCQVFSFKQPSSEELDHDFLWRCMRSAPERGRIGVFNRSYYEEVLVVRVHPEYLKTQRLPDPPALQRLWRERYESIRDYERHLARNGTVILKFWLNVSKEEQRRRFLARLEEPEKNWKFNARDIPERAHWQAYMRAYQDALNATSRPWAPWYAIPADDKHYMRACVADIVVRSLRTLRLHYPKLSRSEQARLRELRSYLARTR